MLENIKELKNKNILVLGLGKSGMSVVRKLSGFVNSITAVDANPYLTINKSVASYKKFKNFELKFILGEGTNERTDLLKNTDIVIISPGIPGDIAVVKAAEMEEIPVWSELELAWRLLPEAEKENTVAVTGTNGKTTVVTLIQQILKDSGRSAAACGNVGNPLINTVDSGKDKELIRVIEVSSFQLERAYHFNPKAGILLNITSDHLDRHHSMSDYAEIKFNLFSRMGKGQWGIFNLDDKFIKRKLAEKNYYKKERMNIIGFSIKKSKNCQVYYDSRKVYYYIGEDCGEIDISKLKLTGMHNISNVMSAISAARIFGAAGSQIESTLKKFRALKHRIEFVAEINGVKIFNDSKATNPDATIKALESFRQNVTLILGGKDKGMDFSSIIHVMKNNVINLVLIGQAREKILNELAFYESKRSEKLPFKIFVCNDFSNAVITALKTAEPGSILLFSPACASFDMFKDYRDRGEKFKKIILDHKNFQGSWQKKN